jgi:TolB protein
MNFRNAIGLAAMLANVPAPVLLAQQPAPPSINGGLPFVSPDGRDVAFIRSIGPRQSDLYLIGADGSGERRLVTVANGGVKWMPDGKSLYYIVGDWMADSSQLFTIARGGGEPRSLGSIPGRDGAIAPDGKALVLSGGKWPNLKLFHTVIGSPSVHELTPTPGAWFNTVYSPDGKQLAVAHGDSTHPLQVWVMNADGSALRQLTHFTDPDGHPQWPTWSPDGKTLAVQSGAYNSQNRALNTAHIWLVDVASGRATKLAAHDRPYLDETPSFFPDGKRIAFQSDRTGRMEIWVMNVDGTGARQVTR